MECGLEGGKTVILQHMQQGLQCAQVRGCTKNEENGAHRLASIVESEEEDLGILVQKAYRESFECHSRPKVTCATHQAEQERPRTS